jgi:predicted restriction endonuclease
VKEIYDHKCMIDGCGYTFMKKNGQPFAEAHHLQALSEGGPDDPSNIVCVCPNHHRQFHHADVEKVSRADSKLVVKINGERKELRFKKRPRDF